MLETPGKNQQGSSTEEKTRKAEQMHRKAMLNLRKRRMGGWKEVKEEEAKAQRERAGESNGEVEVEVEVEFGPRGRAEYLATAPQHGSSRRRATRRKEVGTGPRGGARGTRLDSIALSL